MNPRIVTRSLAALGVPLLWNNYVLPRLRFGVRGRTAATAAFATAYAAACRARPNICSARGLRWGAATSAVVLTGYAAALAIPATRARLAEFTDRAPEVPLAEWLALHIPVGTVYSEELIFRATLDPLLDETTGPLGRWLAAATFGLWHIHPARSVGDSVPTAVAVTTAGGLVLGWLRRHTDSTLAPALLHLALNEGGAIAPRLAVRLGASNAR
ncbi:CPBP family intramembrane glutamic endopeptidase [Nocardia transvalensis]|uniref:CPBP family intramembrane glutamic endopeptidase n=1 Tax=Nocardia transvalensis TaxID=37333 RepID=UPI0018932089|nr:CPBP family intramembrane glutamic endopeptidase [Nocardia transvalensis]MBF6332625.1 CPBP family intramembrane metalloprotease [Nocardia transvalensis]